LITKAKKGGIVGEVINIDGKDLEKKYSLYFKKVREVKGFFEGMESAFEGIDITSCSEGKRNAFLCADMLITAIIEALEVGGKKIKQELKK
jgi:hypothetical protein